MTMKYMGDRKWIKAPKENTSKKNTPSVSSGGKDSSSSSDEKKSPAQKSSVKDKKGKVAQQSKREFINKEETILTGRVRMRKPVPTLKAMENITLHGFGAVLSGKYYVEEVIHSFGSDGYTQELEVSRNAFEGPLVKKAGNVQPKEVEVGGRPRKYPDVMK